MKHTTRDFPVMVIFEKLADSSLIDYLTTRGHYKKDLSGNVYFAIGATDLFDAIAIVKEERAFFIRHGHTIA